MIICHTLPKGPFSDIHGGLPRINIPVASANKSDFFMTLFHKIIYHLCHEGIHIGSNRIKQFFIRWCADEHSSGADFIQLIDLFAGQPAYGNKGIQISGDHAHAISAVINLQSDIHFFCLLYNFLPDTAVKHILQFILIICKIQKCNVFNFRINNFFLIANLLRCGKNSLSRFLTDGNSFIVIQYSGDRCARHTHDLCNLFNRCHANLHYANEPCSYLLVIILHKYFTLSRFHTFSLKYVGFYV